MGLVHGDVKRVRRYLKISWKKLSQHSLQKRRACTGCCLPHFVIGLYPVVLDLDEGKIQNVFYGAVDRKTACAASGYWRRHFWMDSEYLREKAISTCDAV